MMSIDEKQKHKIKKILFGVIFCILSLCAFGILLISQIAHYITVPSPSASTTATIYVIKKGSKHNRASCISVYKVDAKEYGPYTDCSWYSDGSRVTVNYQTTDPSNAKLETRSVGYTFGAIGVILGIISFLMIRNAIKTLKSGE